MRNFFVSIQSSGGTEPMRIVDWANRCKQDAMIPSPTANGCLHLLLPLLVFL